MDDRSTAPADQNVVAPPTAADTTGTQATPQPPDAQPQAPAGSGDATADMLNAQGPLTSPDPAQHASGGLGGRVRAFGKGFVLGGIPGAIAGAAAPDFVNKQFEQAKQTSKAEADTATQDAAMHHIAVARAGQEMSLMPANKQEATLRAAAQNSITMIDKQVATPVSDTSDYATSLNRLHELIKQNPAQSFTVLPMIDAQGGIGYQVASVPNAPLKEDVTFTLPDGSTLVAPRGMPSRVANQMYTNAVAQHAKIQNQLYVADKKADIADKHAGPRAGAVAAAQHPFKMAENAAKYASLNSTRGIWATDSDGQPVATTWGEAQAKGLLPPGAVKDLAPYLKTATDAEKSYQQFQDAYADFKKGTKTGAQSMLALSQHLATTFGGVKGNRITKEMIQEHLGARGISDSALVATQRLSNGDALSPDQWDAFRGLITQSRQLSWGNFAVNSRAVGLNMRSWVPKDLGGDADITDVRNTLLTAPSSKTTVVPKGTPKGKQTSAPKTADDYLKSLGGGN